MPATFLGIDLGTQGLKVQLFSENGRPIAEAYRPYATFHPEPGWAEQEPSDWWHALVACCRGLAPVLARHAPAGIGLTGQMHGVVGLDERMQPVGRCMVWSDSRCTKEAAALAGQAGDLFRRHVCSPLATAYTLPKLLWWRRQQPDTWRRVVKLVFPKDYLRLLLTGFWATDRSDASGSGMYSLTEGDWHPDLVSLIGISREFLPPVHSSTDLGGTITKETAAILGLPTGIPVAVGAGDLAASLLGLGVTDTERVAVNVGTAGQIMCLSSKLPDIGENRYVFASVFTDRFLNLTSTASSGICLNWWRNICSPDAPFEELLAEAATSPAGARRLLFLPHLSGTGSPVLDVEARGCFIGLGPEHKRADLTRAVLEGVAFGLRWAMQSFTSVGAVKDELILGGGAMRHPLWRQIVTDVFAKTAFAPKVYNATALGAAILAAAGVGHTRGLKEAAARWASAGEEHRPQAAAMSTYRTLYPLFLAAYDRLRDTFPALRAKVSPEHCP